jgi:hypothetical protein
MIYDRCKCKRKKIMCWNGSVSIHFYQFVYSISSTFLQQR